MNSFRIFLIAIFLVSVSGLHAQLIVAEPPFPTENQQVVITFNAQEGSGGLAGYTGDVYAHTGVITNNSSGGSDWKYVVANWGVNIPKAKLTRIAPDLYTLTIGPSVRDYYGVPASETILKMAFVFRSGVEVGGSYLEGKTEQNGDIFYDVAAGGLNVSILTPEQMQILAEINETIPVAVASLDADSTVLTINNIKVASTLNSTLNYTINANQYGKYWVKATAYAAEEMVADSFFYFVRTPVVVEQKPEGVVDGINYISETEVILSLFAPFKDHVFVIGDFNQWELDETNYMKRTPDGQTYWISLGNLVPGKEYVYQYLIDGSLIVADPYANKILDPWNDGYISNSTYPDLIPYPTGKTSGIASVFQTAQQAYDWEVTDFTPPAATDLIIYELHIRDFVATRDIKTVIDTLDYLEKLGVNAIELMPINEFDGNDSWGYNPSFYFATDKAYGRAEDYKRFIDECHKRGIAVIIDMVLNHSYGQSPLVQMYFDPNAGDYGQPTAENPWYNQVCPHQPYCWGYDFDHESQHTRNFIDRVNTYWINEFKVDGFRFDFTKGFTNVQTGNQGSNKDNARIAILKRMADQIWEENDKAIVILEHFAENSEEIELSNYGMLLWGNLNYAYNEATMGYNANSNFSGISYKQRGWTNPHLVGYMESHDEERLMFKNHTYGNSSNPWHDVKTLQVGLQRNAAAAAFFLLVPGPKMIWQFGELGYDVSIDDPCRVCAKPIRWQYFQEFDRRQLYHYYSSLIDLRLSQNVFKTSDFSVIANGALKKIRLSDNNMQVVVMGNFGVTTDEINPQFHATGRWYDYYNNDSIDVTDISAPISLLPGEFRIYTTQKLDTPDFVGLPDHKTKHSKLLIFPNPSQNEFTIKLNISYPDTYQLKLLSVSGQTLDVLHKGVLTIGMHQFVQGEELPSGVYFIELTSQGMREVKKLVRL
ncbi:MAG: alpha-amylase family glycosyl hydrolase [Bacteroidales bacterium]|nr:alpha-amylase family glycosyl hydrolase [Bacteroidales bacterium]